MIQREFWKDVYGKEIRLKPHLVHIHVIPWNVPGFEAAVERDVFDQVEHGATFAEPFKDQREAFPVAECPLWRKGNIESRNELRFSARAMFQQVGRWPDAVGIFGSAMAMHDRLALLAFEWLDLRRDFFFGYFLCIRHSVLQR